ncbi:MAG TPA: hypothetical protein VFC31_15615 [Candidatus Limnocylindria bacterium]|nr:hypothetical protein [Candidatus Limnocylindria bacterium]
MTKSTATVTLKLRGGPFNGQSAVAYSAEVGGTLVVNHRNYRITSIEPIPGWNELVGSAVYVEGQKPVTK